MIARSMALRSSVAIGPKVASSELEPIGKARKVVFILLFWGITMPALCMEVLEVKLISPPAQTPYEPGGGEQGHGCARA